MLAPSFSDLVRAMRRTLLLATLILLGAVAFARADGFTGAPSGLLVPDSVVAGDVIELTWRAPVGVIELELEISLDDGRSWSRLSPELPGAVEQWTWRVGRTFSERARLRVRVGTEYGEYDLAPSAAFRILAPAGDEPAPAWHPQAWHGRASVPGALTRPRDRWSPGEPAPPADTRERSARLAVPPPVPAPVIESCTRSTLPAPRVASRAPSFAPMRN